PDCQHLAVRRLGFDEGLGPRDDHTTGVRGSACISAVLGAAIVGAHAPVRKLEIVTLARDLAGEPLSRIEHFVLPGLSPSPRTGFDIQATPCWARSAVATTGSSD